MISDKLIVLVFGDKLDFYTKSSIPNSCLAELRHDGSDEKRTI